MPWVISLSPEAEKQLSRLPRHFQQRIAKAIDQMRGDPFQGNLTSLKGHQWKGRFRKRVGRYRLIFFPHYSEHLIEISQILIRSEQSYR